ncbi:hypothetical protein Leryth_020943 [Lithospermum erythrorhizon]|nr:hypothetical protein Leryth_020943 [Lithospermum erythrorhizon]
MASSSIFRFILNNPSSLRNYITKPHMFFSPFCSSSNNPIKRNTLVNYSLSDSESDSDSDPKKSTQKTTTNKEVYRSRLLPPYDPFNNKNNVIEEPHDPNNLQEVFHHIRSDGLFKNAVKMFDGLSKEGLTHEALELFGVIKDKGQMPEVVAHTAVMEAYVNAGQFKEVHKAYLRMLASGVLPNAYTYGVVIKGLMGSGDEKIVKEGRKIVEEMVRRGMKPNAGVCVGVYEGMVRVGKEEEGVEVLEMVKSKGVVPEEDMVMEILKGKRGKVYRDIMSILYGK